MHQTSLDFQSAMAAKTRKSIAAEVVFEQVPLGAREGAVDTATGAGALSNITQLNDVIFNNERYFSAEKNRVVLDGTFRLPVEYAGNNGQAGFVGDIISDINGAVNPAPKITRKLDKTYSAFGVSINFDADLGTYATDFSVVAYNGSAPVASFDIANNTDVSFVLEEGINNFDKLEITILRLNAPYRCARVTEVTVGIVRAFSNRDLVDPGYVSVLRQIDPTSDTLPECQCTFSFSNLDHKYDPLNPKGAWAYLENRQRVTVRMGVAKEKVSVGRYYLGKWESSSGRVTLTATDRTSFLSAPFPTQYLSNKSYGEIARTALAVAGVAEYRLDAVLETLSASIYLDNALCRDVIRFVASASGLCAWTDTDDVFHIAPLPSGHSGYAITYNNAPEPDCSLSPAIAKIVCNYFLWQVDGKSTKATVEVLTSVASGDTLTLPDNPLINSEAAALAACNRRKAYLEDRMLIKSSWRQNPAVDVCDIVDVQIPFGTARNVLVTRQDVRFNGGLYGITEGKGGRT